MSDEREIDLLAQAASRGRPRGAGAVWAEAVRQAELAPSRRPSTTLRVSVALAVAAGLIAFALTRAPDTAKVRTDAPTVQFADLPEGWTTIDRTTATARPDDDRPRLAVHQRGDDVLVLSGFATATDGIAWSVPTAAGAVDVEVAGFDGRLGVGSDDADLTVLTLTDDRGRRARVVARGVEPSELLGLVGALVGGRRPTGFRTTYEGPERSGVAGTPEAARSSAVVGLPDGRRITVQVADARFDPDATWWSTPRSARVGIHGREALVQPGPDGTTVAWQEAGVSVLVSGRDVTLDELLLAARAVTPDGG